MNSNARHGRNVGRYWWGRRDLWVCTMEGPCFRLLLLLRWFCGSGNVVRWWIKELGSNGGGQASVQTGIHWPLEWLYVAAGVFRGWWCLLWLEWFECSWTEKDGARGRREDSVQMGMHWPLEWLHSAARLFCSGGVSILSMRRATGLSLVMLDIQELNGGSQLQPCVSHSNGNCFK